MAQLQRCENVRSLDGHGNYSIEVCKSWRVAGFESALSSICGTRWFEWDFCRIVGWSFLFFCVWVHLFAKLTVLACLILLRFKKFQNLLGKAFACYVVSGWFHGILVSTTACWDLGCDAYCRNLRSPGKKPTLWFHPRQADPWDSLWNPGGVGFIFWSPQDAG